MLSNYPPGHPTGCWHDTKNREIWYCENCNWLLEPEEVTVVVSRNIWTLFLVAIKHVYCNRCAKHAERAFCERCDAPATHIDYDRAVNYNAPMCEKHYL